MLERCNLEVTVQCSCELNTYNSIPHLQLHHTWAKLWKCDGKVSICKWGLSKIMIAVALQVALLCQLQHSIVLYLVVQGRKCHQPTKLTSSKQRWQWKSCQACQEGQGSKLAAAGNCSFNCCKEGDVPRRIRHYWQQGPHEPRFNEMGTYLSTCDVHWVLPLPRDGPACKTKWN